MNIYIIPPFDFVVLPNTAIPSGYQGNSISLVGCRGEYKTASFAVKYTSKTTVNVAVSDLTGPGLIPASEVDVRAVKCWYQNRGTRSFSTYDDAIWSAPFEKVLMPELLLHDADLVRVQNNENYLRITGKSDPGLWISNPSGTEDGAWNIPNSSRPGLQDSIILQPVSVAAGQNQQYWVTLHIPDEAPAGDYTGQISVNGENIELVLSVLGFNLAIPAKECCIYYSSHYEGDSNGGMGALKNSTQLRSDLLNMRQHGVENYLMVQPPGNETYFHVHMQARDEAGFRGPIIYFAFGDHLVSNPPTQSEINALPGQVNQLKNLVAGYGYTDVYIYGTDELQGDAQLAEVPALDAVRSAGAKVFIANMEDPNKSIGGGRVLADIADLIIRPYKLDKAQAVKLHNKGHKLFSYGNPQGGVELSGTSWQQNGALLYRRNYGLKIWQYDYDGHMTYSFNGNMVDPWNDFDHSYYKDEMMRYPTLDGGIDTIQWEGFREGVNDLRYLNTLFLTIQDAQIMGVDVSSHQTWLANLKNLNLDNQDMDAIRAEMITRILQLKEEDMSDRVIAPGTPKNPRYPVTIEPPGLPVSGKLWVGQNESSQAAASPLVDFTTGNDVSVLFPITTPEIAGRFHVYLDIYYEGQVVLKFQDVDDILILSGSIGPGTW